MTKEQESESGIIGSGAPVCSSNNQQSAMGNQQLRQIPLCPPLTKGERKRLEKQTATTKSNWQLK